MRPETSSTISDHQIHGRNRRSSAAVYSGAALAAAVAKLPGKPCLAVVLVGDDPASVIYVKSKGEKTEAAGMRSITKRFPASATQAEIEAGRAPMTNSLSAHSRSTPPP